MQVQRRELRRLLYTYNIVQSFFIILGNRIAYHYLQLGQVGEVGAAASEVGHQMAEVHQARARSTRTRGHPRGCASAP